jgi:uncharacterized protein
VSTESDLSRLLREMRPELQTGTYLFCSLAGDRVPDGVAALATFREAEGLTLVVAAEEAERYGIAGTFEAAWITLTVHSDLAAVGFLAAVATALAGEGIPCNAIAAFHHDHLFVPVAMAEHAMGALETLQRKNS